MLKRTAAMACVLAVLLATTAVAQEGFSVSVDEAKKQITFASQGQTHMVYVPKKGGVHIKVGTLSYPVRFSIGESGAGVDFMVASYVSATVTRDTAEEKEATAVYSLAFNLGEPGPKTTRGKAAAAGEQAPDFKVQLETTYTMKRNLPCLFVRHTVVNQGEAPFRCYLLGWIGYGDHYVTPGEAGHVKGEFTKSGKIATGKHFWVFLRRKESGVGVILHGDDAVYVGKSVKKSWNGLWLNRWPRHNNIKPGGGLTMEFAVFEAKGADEVAAVSHQAKKQ